MTFERWIRFLQKKKGIWGVEGERSKISTDWEAQKHVWSIGGPAKKMTKDAVSVNGNLGDSPTVIPHSVLLLAVIQEFIPAYNISSF